MPRSRDDGRIRRWCLLIPALRGSSSLGWPLSPSRRRRRPARRRICCSMPRMCPDLRYQFRRMKMESVMVVVWAVRMASRSRWRGDLRPRVVVVMMMMPRRLRRRGMTRRGRRSWKISALVHGALVLRLGRFWRASSKSRSATRLMVVGQVVGQAEEDIIIIIIRMDPREEDIIIIRMDHRQEDTIIRMDRLGDTVRNILLPFLLLLNMAVLLLLPLGAGGTRALLLLLGTISKVAEEVTPVVLPVLDEALVGGDPLQVSRGAVGVGEAASAGEETLVVAAVAAAVVVGMIRGSVAGVISNKTTGEAGATGGDK
mmetsp:Transcript_30808/g.66702  ORF Transcript_30808/g.66702 Transcript_30808/m.66702 type:complete len:314 (+) Transcript_30808:206-1147(+)